jgi:type II secretory pathway pseudopilin PulG
MVRSERRNSSVASEGGFSIVELLVAVTLFSVIMVASVGSVLAVIDANRRAQTAKSVMNNLTFVMDHMSRNIQIGDTYTCGSLTQSQDCRDGGTVVFFNEAFGELNPSELQLGYKFEPSQQAVLFSVDEGANWVRLTAPEVVVEDARFYLIGSPRTSSPGNDTDQPRMHIVMRGFVEINSQVRTDFSLQTTVTQRLLDI